MKDRSLLMSFFFGVILTGFCASLGMIGIAHNMNHKWEQDAFNHGFGYFTFPIMHPEQMTFHWFELLPESPQDNNQLQKINLTAVPVLAEPNRIIEGNSSPYGPLNPNRTGEAREDTTHYRDGIKEPRDFRGGGQFNLSGGATTDEAKATQQRVGGKRAVDQALPALPAPVLASPGDWKNVSQRSGIESETTGDARESTTPTRSVMGADKESRGGDYFLSGSDKRPCKHGSIKAKDGLNSAIVQPDNADSSARNFDDAPGGLT